MNRCSSVHRCPWSSLVNYHRSGQRDDVPTRQFGVADAEWDRLTKWEG